MTGVTLTLPGGVDVVVKEGTTQQQAIALLKKANPAAYQYVQEATAQSGPLPKPTILEGIGRGYMDVVQGTGQLTGLMSPESQARASEEMSLYERGRGDGVDIPRLVGQAAITSPLGGGSAIVSGSGLLARTGAGAVAGGAAGSLPFTNTGAERAQNIVGGAVGGGLFNAVAPAISSGIGRFFGALDTIAKRAGLQDSAAVNVVVEVQDAARQAGVDLDIISDELKAKLLANAQESLDATGTVNAKELVRLARAEHFGFTGDRALTRGQATREARQYSDEVNLAKLDVVGDPLATRFDMQRQQVGTVLDDIGRKVGGDDFAEKGAFETGEAVGSAASARAQFLQERVREAYKAAENAAPDVRIDGDAFKDRVAPILDDFEDKIPAGVKRRIEQLSDPESGREFTPMEAYKLDKLITDLLPADPNAKAEKLAARRLQTAIADAMEDAGGEAGEAGVLYKEAKKVAASRFKEIGDPKGLTAKLVNDVFDPERVVPSLKSGSIRQIQSLAKFLEDSPETWRSVRAAVLNDIVERSMPSGNFSQAAFNRQIQSMGPRRLEAIFGKEGASELREFGRLMQDIFAHPAGNRINTSNTATTGANLARKAFDAVLDASGPFGRPFMMLRDAASGQAGVRERIANVTASMDPLPQPLPIPNLLEPIQPYVAGAAPAAGLLVPQYLRDR